MKKQLILFLSITAMSSTITGPITDILEEKLQKNRLAPLWSEAQFNTLSEKEQLETTKELLKLSTE
jgi:hypothetical protein